MSGCSDFWRLSRDHSRVFVVGDRKINGRSLPVLPRRSVRKKCCGENWEKWRGGKEKTRAKKKTAETVESAAGKEPKEPTIEAKECFDILSVKKNSFESTLCLQERFHEPVHVHCCFKTTFPLCLFGEIQQVQQVQLSWSRLPLNNTEKNSFEPLQFLQKRRFRVPLTCFHVVVSSSPGEGRCSELSLVHVNQSHVCLEARNVPLQTRLAGEDKLAKLPGSEGPKPPALTTHCGQLSASLLATVSHGSTTLLSIGTLSFVPQGLGVLCAGGKVTRASWERTKGTHVQNSTPEFTLGTGCQSKENSGTSFSARCLEKSALFVHVRSGATCVAVCALACASRCLSAFAVVVVALPRSVAAQQSRRCCRALRVEEKVVHPRQAARAREQPPRGFQKEERKERALLAGSKLKQRVSPVPQLVHVTFLSPTKAVVSAWRLSHIARVTGISTFRPALSWRVLSDAEESNRSQPAHEDVTLFDIKLSFGEGTHTRECPLSFLRPLLSTDSLASVAKTLQVPGNIVWTWSSFVNSHADNCSLNHHATGVVFSSEWSRDDKKGWVSFGCKRRCKGLCVLRPHRGACTPDVHWQRVLGCARIEQDKETKAEDAASNVQSSCRLATVSSPSLQLIDDDDFDEKGSPLENAMDAGHTPWSGSDLVSSSETQEQSDANRTPPSPQRRNAKRRRTARLRNVLTSTMLTCACILLLQCNALATIEHDALCAKRAHGVLASEKVPQFFLGLTMLPDLSGNVPHVAAFKQHDNDVGTKCNEVNTWLWQQQLKRHSNFKLINVLMAIITSLVLVALHVTLAFSLALLLHACTSTPPTQDDKVVDRCLGRPRAKQAWEPPVGRATSLNSSAESKCVLGTSPLAHAADEGDVHSRVLFLDTLGGSLARESLEQQEDWSSHKASWKSSDPTKRGDHEVVGDYCGDGVGGQGESCRCRSNGGGLGDFAPPWGSGNCSKTGAPGKPLSSACSRSKATKSSSKSSSPTSSSFASEDWEGVHPADPSLIARQRVGGSRRIPHFPGRGSKLQAGSKHRQWNLDVRTTSRPSSLRKLAPVARNGNVPTGSSAISPSMTSTSATQTPPTSNQPTQQRLRPSPSCLASPPSKLCLQKLKLAPFAVTVFESWRVPCTGTPNRFSPPQFDGRLRGLGAFRARQGWAQVLPSQPTASGNTPSCNFDRHSRGSVCSCGQRSSHCTVAARPSFGSSQHRLEDSGKSVVVEGNDSGAKGDTLPCHRQGGFQCATFPQRGLLLTGSS
eukprot:jgi/Bigna1/70795/fgenesh1_pg.13_\